MPEHTESRCLRAPTPTKQQQQGPGQDAHRVEKNVEWGREGRKWEGSEERKWDDSGGSQRTMVATSMDGEV